MNAKPDEQGSLRILLWVVAIAFFMQMLDTSILNTALPSIAVALKVSPLRMHAVVVAYMLTVATVIPASGWLADRFGARLIFLAAIVIFTLGSLACALSVSLDMMVAARILQGVGGALLVPVGRLCVLRAFPREQLVRALNFVTIPALIGPLLGPTLGGVLVIYGWHWIFLINIPVGLVGFVLTLRHIPRSIASEKTRGFDWPGFALFSLFMLSVTLSLEGLSHYSLDAHWQFLLLAAGLACLGGYTLHALRAQSPLFSPVLFKTRNFTIGILGNLFSRLGGGAMPFLTPLLLQVGLGYSPLKAGLTMLPLTMGAILGKSIVNRLITTLGYRRFLTVNTLLVSLMLASYTLIDTRTPYPLILGLFTAAGLVNSLQFTGMNTLTLIDLPDEQAGSGNSLLSAVMQLSMGLAVASSSAILNLFRGQEKIVIPAFHHTFLALAGLGIISACIFSQARNTRGYARQQPA